MTVRSKFLRGYVLRSNNYRETSLFVDLFTHDQGRISAIAKGYRRKKLYQPLMPFILFNIYCSGGGDLYNLYKAEVLRILKPATLDKTLCGFYINELISKLVPKGILCDTLFQVYTGTLEALETKVEIEACLRVFEAKLLEEIGYGLQLERESDNNTSIKPEEFYEYDVQRGPILCRSEHLSKDAYSGRTFLELRDQCFSDSSSLKQAKRLLGRVIDYHLHGKDIVTRDVIRLTHTH